MIGGIFLESSFLLQQCFGDRADILANGATGNNYSRRIVAARAHGESQAGRAAQLLSGVWRLVMLDYIGRAYAGRESMSRLEKNICQVCRSPADLLPTDAGGPHQIEDGNKADDDIDGAGALDFVMDDRTRFVERDKNCFPNYEIGTCINASYGLGTV